MTVSERAAFDRHMMAIALMMARCGLGQTAPNPPVGAVIVDEAAGTVISRAVTACGGRPHAETIAIAAAGERARGATLYVTLEPCAHHGKTGPCADAVIAAGITRVVCAIEDPDPRVAGRGLDRLRTAGIEVVRGVSANEARWITRGHIVRVTERRPFVTLKMALDADGNVPRGRKGQPLFVTSAGARDHGALLRARSDAILVGAGTVKDDNPKLTCRLPGLTRRSPIRVVLSRTLDIALDSKLAKTAGCVPVWLVCGANVDPKRRTAFESLSAEVITAAEVGGVLWLPSVMEALVARGITRLLVEGGPAIWRAFADASLVDEVALFIAGASGQPARDDQALGFAAQHLGALPLEAIEQRTLGPDRIWLMRRAHEKEGH